MARLRGAGNGAGMEENTMAILDTSCFSNATHHLVDDRFAFLDAVRATSVVPENGAAPTNKMYEAIFQILKDENSIDLAVASYQLLNELDTHFPRVYLSKFEKSESSPSSASTNELIAVEEAWCPFVFNSDFSSSNKKEAGNRCGGLIDATGFHSIIRYLAQMGHETKSEVESKLLRHMLLLQYLVNVLDGDFIPRNSAYKENMNWVVLRESLLSMLLGSHRIAYKTLIKECLYAMCEMSHLGKRKNVSKEVVEKCNTAFAIAVPEIEKCTCVAIQKLLLMIMELDSSKRTADMQGLTTRADGVRTPALEIILDELTYNRNILSPFFQVFNEPKQKLDMVVQYFQKYVPKSSVRTRRSNGSTKAATFGGVLQCFSKMNSTKSVTKKIGIQEAQLLLAHGFQAYLSIPSQQSKEVIRESKEDGGSSLVEICRSFISAFTCLRRTDEQTEVLPLGKEALFTAATILSRSL